MLVYIANSLNIYHLVNWWLLSLEEERFLEKLQVARQKYEVL